MERPTYLLYSILLSTAILAGFGGGSSDTSDVVTPTDAGAEVAVAFETRLITANSEDDIGGWACVAEDGVPFVYTFFDRSTINGFVNTFLGMRLEPLESDGAPWRFRWTPTDGQTVALDSPDGQQSILSNIEFVSPGDYLTALTEDRGRLYCQKQIGTR